ncbi:MAG: porin family protein [Muribaculaceae bacterium]|nr:porin family protein [Muribaculaceae bacterium]
MKKLLIVFALAFASVLSAAAGERGLIVSLDYERSNYDGQKYSNAFRLGASYNIPDLSTGLFIRPQVSLNERWGNTHADIIGSWRIRYNSTGMGIALKGGYRVYKYLELYTGPAVEWYFYNSHHAFSNGSTYAFWEFGAGIPIQRFDIHASYRLHLNTPEEYLEKNRWSIGVSYRF